MNDSSAYPDELQGARPNEYPPQKAPSRLTIDAASRMLHALLATSFAGAYLTAESEYWRHVHTTLGYTAAGLLVARVLWGLMGPRPARWSAWWQKVRGAWQQLRAPARQVVARTSMLHWHHFQHALTVLALVLLVGLTTASGIANDQSWASGDLEDVLEEVHETLGNGLLVLVLVHVGGLLMGSWLKKRNLLMPMVHGRTPGQGPDLVKQPRRGLALLVLVSALGFWGWRYVHAPPPEQDTMEEEEAHESMQGQADAAAGHDRRGKNGDDDDDD